MIIFYKGAKIFPTRGRVRVPANVYAITVQTWGGGGGGGSNTANEKGGGGGGGYASSTLSCLLYTSDAADERSCVDLGGRRII